MKKINDGNWNNNDKAWNLVFKKTCQKDFEKLTREGLKNIIVEALEWKEEKAIEIVQFLVEKYIKDIQYRKDFIEEFKLVLSKNN